MLPSRLALCSGGLFLGMLMLHPGSGASQAPASKKDTAGPTADFVKDIEPILAKYCTACHGGARPKAGMSLGFNSMTEAGKKPQIWEKVAEQLRAGEMPPSGRPRPSAKELELLVGWLQNDMLGGNCTGPRDAGRVTIRRLNKVEYNNTIRDLLFIENFTPADDFPSDDVGYGFDNIGDVLSLSPLLLEKYLAAAEKAARLAFQNPASRSRLLAFAVGKAQKIDKAQAVLDWFVGRAYRRPPESG
jgi:mono/diheme cytochrome c family protein